MFLVGYPQMPEPVIPLVHWHKLTYLVLTCCKTPTNQLNQFIRIAISGVGSLFGRVTTPLEKAWKMMGHGKVME